MTDGQRKKGASLKCAFRPRTVAELEGLSSVFKCAACGKTAYFSGDKGPRRTLGEVVYYRVAMKCQCGFLNFMQVIVNDLQKERAKGTVPGDRAIENAESQGLFLAPELEEKLMEISVAGFREKYDKAMELVHECIDIDSGHPAPWYNLGWLLVKAGDHEKSLEAYRRVVELSDDFPSAWFNMGVIYQTAKKIDEAVNCFDRFLDRFPQHTETSRRKKECLDQKGD